jgi:tetratricopeptide (TPR) repeat protein
MSLEDNTSEIWSFQILSPALSVASIVRPQHSVFAGRSPALTYQSLPGFTPNMHPQPFPVQGAPEGTSILAAAPMQNRYLQTEEERLREELFRAETSFEIPHSVTLDILFELGIVLMSQGRYKSAEEMIRRLVEYSHLINLSDDQDPFDAFSLLGLALRLQGSYAKAEKVLQSTYKATWDKLGAEHPDTLMSMNNLASTFSDQGQWKEAEELQKQVLEVSKRVLREEHLDTLTSMNNLALTFLD